MGLEWVTKVKAVLEEERVDYHLRCPPPHLQNSFDGRTNKSIPCQYMVVSRAEGEGGRGRGKRGPSKRGKKKGAGGEGRGGGPPGVGLLVGGEQGLDDGGQQQVLHFSSKILDFVTVLKML